MKRQYKWLFTIAAIALFLILGSMLPGEPLSNRAMVVGFGIDLTDGNEITVSAQILKGGNASSENSGISSRIVTAQHSTIAGAMSYVSEKAGLTVALTHCNVVLLGSNIAKSPQLYSIMNYLITNNYLSENAYIFIADDNAEELLSSSTGFGGNASLYVQQLVGKYGDYSDVNHKTLQDFVVDYHQLGQANWLPVIKRESVDKEIGENSAATSGESDEYLFSINSIMIFKRNEYIAEYGAEGTEVLNYVKSKVAKGNVEAVGDNGEEIVLYIINKSIKIEYDLDNKKVTADLKIDTLLKEIIDYGTEDKFVDRTQLTDEEINRAQEDIKAQIESFYAEMQSYDLDLFGFYEGFYSKYGKKASDLDIKDIAFEVTVTIQVSDV